MSSDDGKAWTTQYGMAWRPPDSETTTQVQRTASIDGRAVLTIWAQNPGTTIDSHPGIEVYVSAGGRRIRIWDRKSGREMVIGDTDED